MRLFHTAFLEIRTPDLTHGRKNADFGQGFYMTPDEDFAARWAKESKDSQTIINEYELDLNGLTVKEFDRNEEWFSYIYDNRHQKPDALAGVDVISGPIANDTLYDVFGITTSGFLSKEESLSLLLIGPVYGQVVIKTEKARQKLTWLGSHVMSRGELEHYAVLLSNEQESYQELFAKAMEALDS